jgi:hypothetical protein
MKEVVEEGSCGGLGWLSSGWRRLGELVTVGRVGEERESSL